MNSNEIIERVKHFYNLISSEATSSLTIAEALWRLPCQWMRIIGKWDLLASIKCIFSYKKCLNVH
ncbi:hypothetical protein DZ860_22715 [Vibrio sinensis]|uniref:Uncharacterized protein n=1 Tax=Vibrio sinensis TaxID=2302434 RepID=A0A3A6QJ21_9VIBR|nr:hypothetical protein DZ860_22715 [Vibrio sinensis]